MVGAAPEAIISSIIGFYIVFVSIKDLSWERGPIWANQKWIHEVDRNEFNSWFMDSEHKIIRRYCFNCEPSHYEIYYRRRKSSLPFEPYDYMMYNFSSVNNTLSQDFDLFSSYEDALEWKESAAWEACDGGYSRLGHTMGFPGECGERERVERQWTCLSNVECDSGTPDRDVFFSVQRRLTVRFDDLVNSYEWRKVYLCFLICLVALLVMSVGTADIVVWIFIQTDFVKEHKRLVVVFYFLEVCCIAPITLMFYNDKKSLSLTAQLLTVGFVAFIPFIFFGFIGKPRGCRRDRIGKAIVKYSGLFAMALLATPLICFVNLLHFDRSTTFRPVNLFYHVIRFCHVAAIIWASTAWHTNAACFFSIVCSGLQALMVFLVIPLVRHRREKRTAKEFQESAQRAELEADVQPEVAIYHKRKTSRMQSAETVDFVHTLNVVGDTFESLLLASMADSPRVRCAVLGVAVKPLAEGNPIILRRLMPLILPQLLLALRWRTVDANKDEECPLTHFIIHHTLSLKDLPLATMVYWQLFALSCDRKQDTYTIYQVVRNRLLQALHEETFCEETYETSFCKQALALLANQGRMYYQMRAVASMASTTVGSHTEKTAALRSALACDDVFKRWRGRRCLAQQRKMTFLGDMPAGGEAQKCWIFRILCCCCRRSYSQEKPDVVREEWERDVVLHSHENTEMDLLTPKGCPLPVCPTEAIGGVDETKSFVAHSAVAPVVMCCRMATGEQKRRMFALKNGDDLRQDALVLQIFRIMEATWRENGLQNVTLRPYSVLAVSPDEGIVAFVPRAEKVSSILLQYEGNVRTFVERKCEDGLEKGLDRLCGSTAGYCVATYLLGIGDRHLDNLMITEDGHFFHIDFGFVLGDDPKPGAPSLRVPKEVIETIKANGRYERFKGQVGEAFSLLRKTARLWTSLLTLTRRAGGNGCDALIRHGEQGINVVRQRLMLDLSEERAREEMVLEVEASVNSVLPVFYDKVHQVGLFWH